MTNITKTEYVDRINQMRDAPVALQPRVNATDISRAAAQSVTVVAATSGTFPPDASTSDLPGTEIDGSDVRSLIVTKAQAWSHVRKIRYRLTGNLSPPAGDEYTRFAYVTNPVPGTSVPGTGNAIYDILDAGEDCDLSDFNALMNDLKSRIASDNATEEHLITYCHSQCHTQCHNSRGRR